MSGDGWLAPAQSARAATIGCWRARPAHIATVEPDTLLTNSEEVAERRTAVNALGAASRASEVLLRVYATSRDRASDAGGHPRHRSGAHTASCF